MTRHRYSVRSWESFRDETIEAAVVDRPNGNAVAAMVEQEKVNFEEGLQDSLQPGQLLIRVDDDEEWRHGGEHGSDLLLILSNDGTIVRHARFTGREREEQWLVKDNPIDVWKHVFKGQGDTYAVELQARPANYVLPSGVVWDNMAGLRVDDKNAAVGSHTSKGEGV